MIVLTQFSYTSAKNCLMASSVCGEVGFAAMDVLALVVFATAGWEGACRRKNLTSIHPISSAKVTEKKEEGKREEN